MQEMILKTTGLSKSFRSQAVVKEVSLEVPRACVYGILGPNGAGKSTLLKMIAGILRPTGGAIQFDGRPWTRNDLYEIGSLIETPPIYENLTARENLKVRAILLGADSGRMEEVLSAVDLSHTGKKRSGQFSLGMKQRLGIAIALLNHPKLLILDEPMNGLDPIGIRSLRELIQRLKEEGITVIVSSHILSEIEQTADYIGIMADGALEFQGKMPEGEKLEELFMEIAGGKEGSAC